MGLVGRDVMAPIAKAFVHVLDGVLHEVGKGTNRYDRGRKHTGQNKDNIHVENIYIRI